MHNFVQMHYVYDYACRIRYSCMCFFFFFTSFPYTPLPPPFKSRRLTCPKGYGHGDITPSRGVIPASEQQVECTWTYPSYIINLTTRSSPRCKRVVSATSKRGIYGPLTADPNYIRFFFIFYQKCIYHFVHRVSETQHQLGEIK